MAKKKTATEAEEEQQELPAPDPPKVKSEPTEPAAPDAVVEEGQVGADPEDPDAVRELDLLHHESIRGQGPRPEAPEPAEAEQHHKKKKEQEKEQ